MDSQGGMERSNLKPKGQTRRFFTQEEDQELIKQYNKFKNDWKHIAEHMEDRTPKQCRDRYLNYLDPQLTNAEWSMEEDRLLMKLANEHGHNWKEIAVEFVGRSPNNVKNRYHKCIKKNSLLGYPFQLTQAFQPKKNQQRRARFTPQDEEINSIFEMEPFDEIDSFIADSDAIPQFFD